MILGKDNIERLPLPVGTSDWATDPQLNGPLHFPAAFSAELFWSADEDFATIRDRVLNRANVIR